MLRVGHSMVDRIDALTRLNRSKGPGTAFITHSLADLEALPDPEDRAKARGFADRCAVMIGACATRSPRETRGQVAVFDPQQIRGSEPQRLWWNPLAAITPSPRPAAWPNTSRPPNVSPG